VPAIFSEILTTLPPTIEVSTLLLVWAPAMLWV
jgi:hypothetical protein